VKVVVENAASDDPSKAENVTMRSVEIVVALVGYAGAGCSSVAGKLITELVSQGYDETARIKFSDLIVEHFPEEDFPSEEDEPNRGKSKFQRAKMLQDFGDELREDKGDMALSALAIKKLREKRGTAGAGQSKRAFVLDSIKHFDEVDLLRQVYGKSFYLLAIHCDKAEREKRLIGNDKSESKFAGVAAEEVNTFLNRDEKDGENSSGQQVVKAFHRADYFIDNNNPGPESVADDLRRFVELILGSDLVRPKLHETGMYHAHTAALRSSCLSRQVGASLQAKDGTVVATGANDVPAYDGGICGEDHNPLNRCFSWELEMEGDEGKMVFKGCHNSRKKKELQVEIAKWMDETFSMELADQLYPKKDGELDVDLRRREEARRQIQETFNNALEKFDDLPGVKDAIEYSRSIHAEMNTLFNAAANEFSPVGCSLFTTTFPCHNCARHLVTAGIKRVYYIEPYIKSLALELHSDSITTVSDPRETKSEKMTIQPYTGIGPSIYGSHFLKRGELKDARTGEYDGEGGEVPHFSIRLENLDIIENNAIKLLSS
jgi:deoxycytidylate deaminase